MTDNRSAGKARQRLAMVTPGQVTAMRETDPDTLRALVAAVFAATAYDADDVREHAALIVAAYYSGGGAADTLKAARAAARDARVTVAMAAAADAWDVYGDMTDDVVAEWQHADMRTTLTQWGTAPADLVAVTTPRDVVDYAVSTVDGVPGVTLSRAVADMRAHDGDDCPRCTPGAGRRPSLTGITAHAEGWTGADSAYHASRRHTVAALRAVDPDAVLSAMGGAPLAGRPRATRATGGDRTPRTTDHGPDVATVTVRTRDGEVITRPMTEAEGVAVAVAGKRANPARHAGEEYGANTSPAAVGRPGANGQVPSGKVAPSPRKRPGSNTGPTVPARLS